MPSVIPPLSYTTRKVHLSRQMTTGRMHNNLKSKLPDWRQPMISESAILEVLSGGAYTAILRGSNNEVGVGLIEVYNLP